MNWLDVWIGRIIGVVFVIFWIVVFSMLWWDEL